MCVSLHSVIRFISGLRPPYCQRCKTLLLQIRRYSHLNSTVYLYDFDGMLVFIQIQRYIYLNWSIYFSKLDGILIGRYIDIERNIDWTVYWRWTEQQYFHITEYSIFSVRKSMTIAYSFWQIRWLQWNFIKNIFDTAWWHWYFKQLTKLRLL